MLIVGHQSSGKSALIVALMGFQFNQVGGGTKTRRPIALRMQHDPTATKPRCFLTDDISGRERELSLSEARAHIERENRRLERDPLRGVERDDIRIRVEYRYCPNMIVIDTPGLIQTPFGHGLSQQALRQLSPQQRAQARAAREVEQLVLEKMRRPEYVILCVEDAMDWKHGPTREVVARADPELSLIHI